MLSAADAEAEVESTLVEERVVGGVEDVTAIASAEALLIASSPRPDGRLLLLSPRDDGRDEVAVLVAAIVTLCSPVVDEDEGTGTEGAKERVRLPFDDDEEVEDGGEGKLSSGGQDKFVDEDDVDSGSASAASASPSSSNSYLQS